MPVRIYLVAAESADPLSPSFRHIPGGRLTGAFEVLDFDAFMRLDNRRVREIGGELAAAVGRPSLVFPGAEDAADLGVGELYADADLPAINHHDPAEGEP